MEQFPPSLLIGLILVAVGLIVIALAVSMLASRTIGQGKGVAVVLLGPVPIIMRGNATKVALIAILTAMILLLFYVGGVAFR
ncbi:MAG: DUF131 domain-containing protein [Aigarchaeota archaeon]|nr:DUF131 domain-containing protein [Aigarchaeota archaeon]MDW8092965.1 DUF131 domain-containing protein [Nitrososphaerota archaeon]